MVAVNTTLCGGQEHHSIKVEDFAFIKDDNNNVYISLAERITKTKQIGLHCVAIPKMFVTNTLRCPANFFQLYLSEHPLDLCTTGTLFLDVKHHPATNVYMYR